MGTFGHADDRGCPRFVHERRSDRVSGHRIGVRQEVRIRAQDRFRIVPKSAGDDAQRDGRRRRERERRARVPQDVRAAGRDLGRLAVADEPLREALRVNPAAELVGEHEILVLVGGPG